MNNYLKFAISLFANLSGGIIKKRINDRYENNFFSYQLYNCIVSLSASVTLFFLCDNFKISLYTIVLALIFGFVTLLQQAANLIALENGPFSYTSVIISFSTLIPAISGRFFWNESIDMIQYLGILLMLICFIFSVDFRKNDRKANFRWLIYSFSAFLFTGLIGVMQKLHQSSVYKDELDAFLIVAFGFSFVCSCVLMALFRSKRKLFSSDKKSILTLMPLVLMLLSGIFAALNNKLNLYLSGVIDSAVFFPIVNGGGLILTSVAAVIIFKERLTIRQWFGLGIGIVSVILLCNPF